MTEDPHEKELTELEKQIKELESSDDTKPENGKKVENLKVEGEDDYMYVEETIEEKKEKPSWYDKKERET